MQNSAPLSIAALAIAAAALGLVLLDAGGAPTPRDITSGANTSATDEALLTRLAALERDNRALRDRISLLESIEQPSERTAIGAGATTEDLAALREELLARIEARTSDPLTPESPWSMGAGAPDEFKQQVANTLEQIQRDSVVQKSELQFEERVRSIDDRMLKLEGQLGLSRRQSSDLRRALLDEYGREIDLTRRWAAGEDDVLLGEAKVAAGAAYQQDLAAILSAEQLDVFTAPPAKRVPGAGTPIGKGN